MASDSLTLTPRLNGRTTVPVTAEAVRMLTPADLSLLGEERGIKPTRIKRLRDRHHSLARCLAQGMKDWEASAVTGYDPSRISILKSDPTFLELIEFYREAEDASLAEFTKRASLVTTTALDNMLEQLEDEENPLSFEQNLAAAKTFADRLGFAPIQKSVSVNANVELPGRLSAAKARLAALAPAASDVIDGVFSVGGMGARGEDDS